MELEAEALRLEREVLAHHKHGESFEAKLDLQQAKLELQQAQRKRDELAALLGQEPAVAGKLLSVPSVLMSNMQSAVKVWSDNVSLQLPRLAAAW